MSQGRIKPHRRRDALSTFQILGQAARPKRRESLAKGSSYSCHQDRKKKRWTGFFREGGETEVGKSLTRHQVEGEETIRRNRT